MKGVQDYFLIQVTLLAALANEVVGWNAGIEVDKHLDEPKEGQDTDGPLFVLKKYRDDGSVDGESDGGESEQDQVVGIRLQDLLCRLEAVVGFSIGAVNFGVFILFIDFGECQGNTPCHKANAEHEHDDCENGESRKDL